MYEVEKGHPVPKDRRRWKYPWRDLEVGDSFFVPKVDRTLKQMQNVTYCKNRNKAKRFVCRPIDGGTRVWRVN